MKLIFKAMFEYEGHYPVVEVWSREKERDYQWSIRTEGDRILDCEQAWVTFRTTEFHPNDAVYFAFGFISDWVHAGKPVTQNLYAYDAYVGDDDNLTSVEIVRFNQPEGSLKRLGEK